MSMGEINFPCPESPVKYARKGISAALYRRMISRGIDSICKSHFRSRGWLCLRLVANPGCCQRQKRGLGRPAKVSSVTVPPPLSLKLISRPFSFQNTLSLPPPLHRTLYIYNLFVFVLLCCLVLCAFVTL